MSTRVSTRRFIDAMSARGFGPYIGVPCSFLRPFIDYVIDRDDLGYIAATNEGEALAVASGAQLAGRRPVVMLQNSGLGNLVNPLASLNQVFRIPVLLIVTLRGEPGLLDEPQHELMGRTTGAMLDLLEVPHEWFPSRDDQIDACVDRALRQLTESERPFAFVLRKNVVDEYAPRTRATKATRPLGTLFAPTTDDGAIPPRRDAIAHIAGAADSAAAADTPLIVATTGKTGRELSEIRDAPNHLYVVGSMGCASSLALGVARESNEPVIVLDGDGAALMRLEALATIGNQAPTRFIHLILDNESYESTGRQATISAAIRFPEIAIACGYATACSATGLRALDAAPPRAKALAGPHPVPTPPRFSSSADLGRPAVQPPEVAARFRAEIARRWANR